jgi:methyltransferase
LALVFIVFEGTFYPTFQFEINYKVFFIGLLALSSVLRWWAIDSVNSLWTYRCLAHPQMRHYALGPYRFLSHPEYFSRILDLASLSIIFDAPLSGLVFGLVAVGLSFRLAMAEQSHYLVVRSLKNAC